MAYKVLHILLIAFLAFQSVVAVSAVLPVGDNLSGGDRAIFQVDNSADVTVMAHVMDDMPPCHNMNEPGELMVEMECNACDEHDECSDSCGATCVPGLSLISDSSFSKLATSLSLHKRASADSLYLGALGSIYHPPILS